MPDLLVEIGCEELPAAHCRIAEDALPGLFAAELERAGIPAERVGVHVAPRRLAVDRHGSSRASARPSGARCAARAPTPPTRPGRGSRASTGRMPRSSRSATGSCGRSPRGRRRRRPSCCRPSSPASVAALQFPRTMRWPGGRFSRPIRWLVVKLDGAVVAAEVAGVRAAGESRGHRGRGASRCRSGRPRPTSTICARAGDGRRGRAAGERSSPGSTRPGGWIDPMGEAGGGRLPGRVAARAERRVRPAAISSCPSGW